MALFNSIAQFLKRLFHKEKNVHSQAPQLRQIELELKNHPAQIYKNAYITPAFAQVIHILQGETVKMHNFLLETLYNPNRKIAMRYSTSLIETGFTQEQRDLLESLSYENRKKEYLGKALGVHAEIKTNQEKAIARALSFFDADEFKKIEQVIRNLDHLFDVCQFNYVSFLTQFDQLYSERKDTAPRFSPLLLADAETHLVDLYYLAAGFTLSLAEARALEALCFVHNGYEQANQKCFLKEVKTIHAAFKNILNADTLQKMIFIIKGKTDVLLQVATYNRNVIEPYKEKMKKKFDSESKRIAVELQDEKNTEDIKTLFDNRNLLPLQGYTQELSHFLQSNSVEGFLHIVPLSIINTFMRMFLTDRIVSYLNRIVVEGFFTKPSFKSDFSSAVFACSEIDAKLRSFENEFTKGQTNDLAVLRSNALEGQQNIDLLKKVSFQIDTINHDAQRLMQEIMNDINSLAHIIEILLSEAKKSNPSDISNIKLLVSSVRNKDDAEELENHFSKWMFFIDIMQNYVIITDKDRKKLGS